MSNDKNLELANPSDLDKQFIERATQDYLLTRSLILGLRRASGEYANDQRAAWCFALDTVANFLQAIGVESRLFAPLRALSCAVDDLQYGIVDKGLKPAPFKGGPRMPTNMFLNQVMAVVAVTLLHEDTHMSLDEALTEASKLSGTPKTRLAQFRKNTVSGRRSWKAYEYYWIRLKRLRADFKAPEQRIGYMREWFANGGYVPLKVP
jgi:hypothetical protein